MPSKVLAAVKEGCLLALTVAAVWAIVILAPAAANLLWSTNRAVWHADLLLADADTVLVKTAPDLAGTLVALREISVKGAQSMVHVEGILADGQRAADDAMKPKTKAQRVAAWTKAVGTTVAAILVRALLL